MLFHKDREIGLGNRPLMADPVSFLSIEWEQTCNELKKRIVMSK